MWLGEFILFSFSISDSRVHLCLVARKWSDFDVVYMLDNEYDVVIIAHFDCV